MSRVDEGKGGGWGVWVNIIGNASYHCEGRLYLGLVDSQRGWKSIRQRVAGSKSQTLWRTHYFLLFNRRCWHTSHLHPLSLSPSLPLLYYLKPNFIYHFFIFINYFSLLKYIYLLLNTFLTITIFASNYCYHYNHCCHKQQLQLPLKKLKNDYNKKNN